MPNPVSERPRFNQVRVLANMVVWSLLLSYVVLFSAGASRAQTTGNWMKAPVDAKTRATSNIVAVRAVDSGPPDVSAVHSSVVAALPSAARGKLPTYFPVPTLRNPQLFGLIAGDATSALRDALNAGDVQVARGTYLVNGTINFPSNRNLRCDAGAEFYASHPATYRGIRMFEFSGTKASSIVGCAFRGSNTSKPLWYDPSGPYEWDFPIELTEGASWIVIAYNHFANFFSNTAIMNYTLHGGTTSYNTIVANVCAQDTMPAYCIVIDGGNYNLVSGNIGLGSNIGMEPDGLAQTLIGNKIINNYVGRGVNKDTFIGGAAIRGFDYSTNTVSGNTVDGARILSPATLPWSDGGKANMCVNGCSSVKY